MIIDSYIIFISQVACYRDPLMPHELHNHLQKRKSVEVPDVDSINDEHKRYKAKLKKAQIWAKFVFYS